MLYLLIFALLLFWYSDILSHEIKVRVRCFARAFFVPSRAKKRHYSVKQKVINCTLSLSRAGNTSLLKKSLSFRCSQISDFLVIKNLLKKN